MAGTEKGEPALPGLIGRYRPVKLLGRGGMAEVFLAEISGPGGFNRRVALKMVLPAHSSNPDITRMFLDEARVAANFTHPHVVQVYDFGEVDGRYFIAMEYARGLSLRALLAKLRERRQRVPDVVVAAMGSHACSALAYVHTLTDREGEPLRIVHRDITPENLFFTVEGVTKVLDFGIARAQSNSATTEVGLIKGKPAYMSPEQANAEPLDGRSDVFSLGITLWEAVATRRLYEATDMLSLIASITARPATDIRTMAADVGEGLAEALMSALERDRLRRPTAKALQSAFDTLLQKSDYPNSQDVIAAFIKGTLPPASLGAKPANRPPSSPGSPLRGVTPPPGTDGVVSTPAAVEAISEWPIRTEAMGSAATEQLSNIPPEWAALPAAPAKEPSAAQSASEDLMPSDSAEAMPPPPVRPSLVPAPAVETPIELDRQDRFNPAPPARSSLPTAAAVRAQAMKPKPSESDSGGGLWIGLAVVVVLVGVWFGAPYLRPAPPPPPPPSIIPAPITVELALDSDPPGAAIELDGKPTGQVTPSSIQVATFEDHAWAMVLPGYMRVAGKATRDQLTSPIHALLFKQVEEIVESTPAGAQIQCDGTVVIPATPGRFSIPAGEHTLLAEKAGFVPVEETTTLGADHHTWSPTLVPAAYLDLSSDPSGAEIAIDGKTIPQQTPATHLPISAGKPHTLVVTQDKFVASQHLRKLVPGSVTKVALHLADPADAASDPKNRKLLARQRALESEKDSLESKNASFVPHSPSELREMERRDKRIQAIDDAMEEIDRQLYEVGD